MREKARSELLDMIRAEFDYRRELEMRSAKKVEQEKVSAEASTVKAEARWEVRIADPRDRVLEQVQGRLSANSMRDYETEEALEALDAGFVEVADFRLWRTLGYLKDSLAGSRELLERRAEILDSSRKVLDVGVVRVDESTLGGPSRLTDVLANRHESSPSVMSQAAGTPVAPSPTVGDSADNERAVPSAPPSAPGSEGTLYPSDPTSKRKGKKP